MAADQTGGFVMRSSRSVASRGLIHIGRQIEELEKAVVENPGLAFDLSKNLIEGVCKRILQDRAVQFSNDDASTEAVQRGREEHSFLAQDG